jgi:hypothetical protein
MRSFYQDRLGTNIGKALKKDTAVFSGSAFYKTHDNFFPFSVGGLKSDFGGHDNHQFNNMCLLREIDIVQNASEIQTGWSPRSKRSFER